MDIETKEVQTILDWTRDQVYLHAASFLGKRARTKRGQVFRCKFGVGIGSELRKIRPAVVISEHINNQNSEIIVVAPITHTHKNLPGCVAFTPKTDAGGNTILDGCVNVSAMRSLSVYRLCGYICDLDSRDMDAVDTALARHLDLLHHYATVMRISSDKDDRINRLNDLLSSLRSITGAESNKALLDKVTALVENSEKQP
jgi:mRNA-degrading endonuclease toxin of MazEF toxin-antitoxin module